LEASHTTLYFPFWNEQTPSSFTSWNTTTLIYSMTRMNCGGGIVRKNSKSILLKRWKLGETNIWYVQNTRTDPKILFLFCPKS